MAIVIQIESPPGTPVSKRQFAHGEIIAITGKVTLLPFIPAAGFPVTLDITGEDFPTISLTDYTDLLGNFAFDIQMPYNDAKAVMSVVGYRITGSDTVVWPISVGDIIPDELPKPKDVDYVKWIAVAGFALLLGYAWIRK